MSNNFTSILDTPFETVERPKPLPNGTYNAVIMGLPEQKQVDTKNGPADVIVFKLKFISAWADVPQDQVASFNLSTQVKDYTFWVPREDASEEDISKFKWRMKNFFEICGIDGAGKSLTQCLSETPNRYVGVVMKQKPSTSGEEMYANIEKIVKAQ